MIRVTNLNYQMHQSLRDNLRSLSHNMKNDWDFVCLISGSGMTRVGKSMIAQQIAYYISTLVNTPFTLENVVFSGDELITKAQKMPHNSVIIYDEARAELDSKKVMMYLTQKLLDFFAECGVYNHFIIIVLPDFFDLPKSIAISKSEICINVLRDVKDITIDGNLVQEFERGHFCFYNRLKKKRLYINGKKYLDYGAEKPVFYGEYPKYWVLDEAEYNKVKLEYLKRARGSRVKPSIEIALKMVRHPKLSMLTNEEIAKICGITRMTLYNHLNKRVNVSYEPQNDAIESI